MEELAVSIDYTLSSSHVYEEVLIIDCLGDGNL
jgi:hypothetical protein